MPSRNHLRRLEQTWVKQPLYFLTICTAARQAILTRPQAATILTESWRAAPAIHRWVIGRYVIMPDHVHFFASPQTDAKTLSAFIRDWKKWTTRQLRLAGLAADDVWQAEFFDHVLHSANSYEEKWLYVRENPVRAGLVAAATDWPYAGECASISFTKA